MLLRIATCVSLPEPDPDRAPLEEALAKSAVRAEWVAWDDPDVDWERPIPTIVRSTWNYHIDRERFLGWCERVSSRAPFWNPPDVIRANTHKRYLLDLHARGLPTVPTALVSAQRAAALRVAELGWERVVIKPAVGAGSIGARSFAGDDPDAEVHLAHLARRGDVLIQPYLDAVDAEGEHSLVWIDGELTHQVRKAPRFAGQDECITEAAPMRDDARGLALAVLAPIADRILYGRVDIVRDRRGEPLIMEVELSEPSLYFRFCPGSAERYVAGVTARLAGQHRAGH